MNPLLGPVETDILFSRKDILSFRFFWKVSLQLQGGQYILKNIISARGNRFLIQILIRMEVAFWSSEIAFFKESLILASGNGFSINYKLCAFIRSFFLKVDTMLETMCKPIFFGFFYSEQWTQFFNASFR